MIPATLHSYALTDLTTVKAVLGITDASKDELLKHLINAMTDNIESICGRRFKAPGSDAVELVNGTGRPDIFVKNYPLISVTKVEKKTSNSPLTFEEILAGDYVKEDAIGRFRLQEGDSENDIQNYRVTYKGGYAVIPVDLEQACISLVSNEFNDRKARGIQSESLGQYSVTYGKNESELDPEILQVVKRYKRISVL